MTGRVLASTRTGDKVPGPAEAFFHIVRNSTSLDALSWQLFDDSAGADAREFRRINQEVSDSLGQVLQGQFLFVPDGRCRADEQDIIATLRGVNEVILWQMDWLDRQTLAEGYQFLDNAANNPTTMKTTLGVVNSSASGLISVGSLQVRQVRELLRELERQYVQTYKAHGRLTPAFYAHRQRTFRTLDSAVGRMVRTAVLGSPMSERAKRTLKVNNKSQILHWNRNGVSNSVLDFRSHFRQLHRINSYLRYGGVATIGIDALLTADTVVKACKEEDKRQCSRSTVVESSALAGRIGGAAFGGTAGYLACNIVLGKISLGTSLFLCSLVVGGGGAFIGSQQVGAGLAGGSKVLFDKAYPVSP